MPARELDMSIQHNTNVLISLIKLMGISLSGAFMAADRDTMISGDKVIESAELFSKTTLLAHSYAMICGRDNTFLCEYCSLGRGNHVCRESVFQRTLLIISAETK